MLPWLNDPQAGYVIAAYAVAGAFLLGLFLASWFDARRQRREWERLKAARLQQRP